MALHPQSYNLPGVQLEQEVSNLQPNHVQTLSSLSVIVPTRNEAKNVWPLLERIGAAVKGITFEVIFVDDSDDDTPQVIEQAAQSYPFPVTVISRPPQRRNGLGKAVVEGMSIARSKWILVMDGDLQHPPELIPELLDTARATGANLVATTRLAKGGGTAGLSFHRKIISRTLAFLSRILFPKHLQQVSDPLTGYFLVRRDVLDLDQLQPEGFKILLEILIRTPELAVAEVPFEFGERHHGKSKANPQETFILFRQMLRLLILSQWRLVGFVAVGGTGLIVNTLLLVLFVEPLGLHYLPAVVLATQGSSLWNFILTEGWVFRDRSEQSKGRGARLLGYLVMNNAALLLRGPILALLISVLGVHYVAANVISLVVMTLARYMVADRLIWSPHSVGARRKQRFNYSIHNLINIRSEQELPELAYFRTEEAAENLDIDVRIVGNPYLYKQPDSICFNELFGRLGFCIVINRTDQITRIYASYLVGMSPHVLYTNVVEASLRWLFVRKGYALMHGASLAFGDKALFITAQTDTGKTTTILHTIRNNIGTGRFLSDDMSIISRDGKVRNYPKPLTISQHTVQAIGGAPLRPVEKLALKLQSRVHSRTGRSVAKWLDSGFVPAATINAIVQIIIPPPKYMVTEIIPATQYCDEAQLDHIVLIERGADFEVSLAHELKVQTLISNADDAYGFPPYQTIAPLLSKWNGLDMHEAEQEIVAAAVEPLPATHIGSSRYDWYKRLPSLVRAREVAQEVANEVAHGLGTAGTEAISAGD
jgi:glycosyltransferase involved in cell wall biosynthesis